MAVVYLYVLGASSDPDRLVCSVPWRVSKSEILFGPCKKKLRERLRPRLLGPQVDRAITKEDIVFVGFNAVPAKRVRKVVWAGRIREAMSFGRAWLDLTGPEYAALRSVHATPLHLEPIEGDGRPIAYRHFGLEHAKGAAWLDDIFTRSTKRIAQVSGETVRLMRGVSWWDGFPRDICFLLDNIFFADGVGIGVDDELVSLLRDAQPDRDGVTDLAVFGRTRSGQLDGRRGGYLELTGSKANQFLKWLDARVPEALPSASLTDAAVVANRVRGRPRSC
jgi:hypothetical protein